MKIKRFPADQEYERHVDLSKDAVRRILDWVQNQPQLPNIKEEDVILFLGSCNYDEEYAKKTIDLHYIYKAKHPELFNNWDPLDSLSNLSRSVGIYITLPGLTAEGHKVIYIRILQCPDWSKFDPMSELKNILCALELMLHEEGAIRGWHFVCDLDGTPFSAILRFSPIAVRNLLYFCQEAAPIQLKGVHLINPPKWVTYLTNLLTPLMKKSVVDMLKVYHNLEDFHHVVPKRNLPVSCGGELASLQELDERSRNKLKENREILLESQTLKAQLPKEDRSWGYFWR